MSNEQLIKKSDINEERRAAPRNLTLLRIALLHVNGEKELCLVRNISSGGLMARLYRELPVDVLVEVELTSGMLLRGKVVWSRDWDIGIAFDQQVDVDEILASRWVAGNGLRPRLPRIEVDCPARLRVGARIYIGIVCDISQGGAKIECAQGLHKDGDIVLMLPSMPPIHGLIRWRAGKRAGLSFNEPLGFDTLVRWLQEQRGIGAAGSATDQV